MYIDPTGEESATVIVSGTGVFLNNYWQRHRRFIFYFKTKILCTVKRYGNND